MPEQKKILDIIKFYGLEDHWLETYFGFTTPLVEKHESAG